MRPASRAAAVDSHTEGFRDDTTRGTSAAPSRDARRTGVPWPSSMNPLLYLAALLLSSFPVAGAIDDPPPEPIDCPLCGGDPAIHARRMFGMTRLAGDVVSYSLRW